MGAFWFSKKEIDAMRQRIRDTTLFLMKYYHDNKKMPEEEPDVGKPKIISVSKDDFIVEDLIPDGKILKTPKTNDDDDD